MTAKSSGGSRYKSLMREVNITAIAAGATLVFAIAANLVMPEIQLEFKGTNSLLDHRREFATDSVGGSIIYFPVADARVSEAGQLESLKQDLEILSRRFQRGKYDMMAIPGSRQSEVVKEIIPLKEQYKYDVEIKDHRAVLHIAALNPGAVKPLQNYLEYLKARWMVTSTPELKKSNGS